MVLRGDEQARYRLVGCGDLRLRRGQAPPQLLVQVRAADRPASREDVLLRTRHGADGRVTVEQLGEAGDRGLQHLLEVGSIAELDAQRRRRLAADPAARSRVTSARVLTT